MRSLQESLFDQDIASKDVRDTDMECKEFKKEMEKALNSLKTKYWLGPRDISFAVNDYDNSEYCSAYIHLQRLYTAKTGKEFTESVFIDFYVGNKITMHPFRFTVAEVMKERKPRLFSQTKLFYMDVRKRNIPHELDYKNFSSGSAPLQISLTYKNKDHIIDFLETIIKWFFDNQKRIDVINGYFEDFAINPTKSNNISRTVLTKMLRNVAYFF